MDGLRVVAVPLPVALLQELEAAAEEMGQPVEDLVSLLVARGWSFAKAVREGEGDGL